MERDSQHIDFDIIAEIKENSGLSYRGLAEISGIKWSRFHSFMKNGRVPMKQAMKVCNQIERLFLNIGDIFNSESEIKNIKRDDTAFRHKTNNQLWLRQLGLEQDNIRLRFHKLDKQRNFLGEDFFISDRYFRLESALSKIHSLSA